MEKIDCTGVILAGGCNSRLPGINKAFQKVGANTMLARTHALFSMMFKEVILVVNDPALFLDIDALVVTDIDPSQCALAGLHAGLFHACFDWSCVTACDVPFVNEKIIRYLLAQRSPGKQIIIPRTWEGLEPLSALYHKSCLPRIETNLKKKVFMVKKFFKPERVKQIPPQTLEALDPDLRFKFNVNTPADLETAREMAQVPDPGHGWGQREDI
ncbi:molybdenum cofactor guanylyltransferase [Desulfobacter hydrogenophilus]|uniref:Probable molybdenum cofactor guanylyltransferase n=1 Tax=Desulfobacter hydrogenophilus TaxID=2291 RepID=A0A328FD53_9BACT|nr:molybdenum cofactor guanylyltransferase [Desulfobacter hydrogenophilus]NDY71558.1 molybdenum cofactor guanylyltransferase [Desulfobacter hydrogenophilus]QBH11940.1 molybdenum cofactor guanylyltransferase [Desulfobacter hydrogenophilus]RAM02581.1 molybdenum cofactor guanylyltransferase [Desulfobacter hydrogenophilus]